MRVPAIFRWPGRIQPGTETDALLSHLDVLPLCLNAAGVQLPSDRVLDGVDPLPVLTGREPSPHTGFTYGYARAAALREGPLKIVRAKPDVPWELYDLASDPGETTDLTSSRPADVARLDAAYKAWQIDMQRDSSQPEKYAP